MIASVGLGLVINSISVFAWSMPSNRALFALIYLISLIYASHAFVVPDCVGDSPHIFDGSLFIDYTRGALDNGDLQELRAYFDAYENNQHDEALSHLRKVKIRNVIRRSINRTITPIVRGISRAESCVNHVCRIYLFRRSVFSLTLSKRTATRPKCTMSSPKTGMCCHCTEFPAAPIQQRP